VLRDTAFHAAEDDPVHRTWGQRGAWNDRRLLATVLSRLTVVSHFQQVMHRVGVYCQARLACTLAAFHGLGQWEGLPPDEEGFVPLSIAEYSL